MATLLEICSQIIIDMFSNNYWKYVLRQYIAVINSVINYFEVILLSSQIYSTESDNELILKMYLVSFSSSYFHFLKPSNAVPGMWMISNIQCQWQETLANIWMASWGTSAYFLIWISNLKWEGQIWNVIQVPFFWERLSYWHSHHERSKCIMALRKKKNKHHSVSWKKIKPILLNATQCWQNFLFMNIG